MPWLETARGKHLNIDRVSVFSIAPDSQEPGKYAVFANFGRTQIYVDSFATRVEAGEYIADLIYPEDD